MNDILIRPGCVTDAEAVARILDSTDWPNPYFSSSSSRQKAIEQQLVAGVGQSKTYFLVAEMDAKVVGYTLWHFKPCLFLPGPEGTISDLFVLESHRGKNVGGALIQAVVNQAIEKRCYRLMLLTRKARQSYKRSFYKKIGWNERAGVANFVFDAWHL